VIVVDASAVIDLLVGLSANPGLVERLERERDLHAPHLIDLEFLQTLRRLESARLLSDDRAADARSDYEQLRIVRYPHEPLLDRVWELRFNLSAYDSVYIALSEALQAPIATTDMRLSRAPGHLARVEVFPPP
jgi:predicted nucleic acid-binding protein